MTLSDRPSRKDPRLGRMIAVAVGLSLVLVGCSSGDTPASSSAAQPASSETTDGVEPSTVPRTAVTSATTTTPAGQVTTSLPAPDPVAATVTLDTTAGVSETVGPDGGQVQAIGSDGRHYLLTVPPGLLAADVEITMTPIADITTPLLREFGGGAQFGPDGLTFSGVAWLEITGGSVSQDLVGFSYLGEGEDVAIGAMEGDGGVVRVPVTHFSGAGAGAPAPGADGSPTDPVRAMGQALTKAYVDNEYNCIDLSHPLGEFLIGWYQALFANDVEPGLEQASSNDMVLSPAIDAAMRWRAARQYYAPLLCEDAAEDIDNLPEDDRADELITAGIVNAIDTAADSCATTHDLGETRYMLAWRAVAVMLFGDDDGTWSSLASERVRGCLTFEVQFHSYIEVTDSPVVFTADMESTVAGLVPVGQAKRLGLFIADDDDGVGTGPLSYTPRLEMTTNGGCPVDVTRVEAHPASALLPDVPIPDPIRQVPLGVASGADAGVNQSGGEAGEVSLIFFPLAGSEYFETSCTDLLGGPNPDGAWGPWTFNGIHEEEMNSEWDGFTIKLDRGTGKLYGRATYQRTETRPPATIYEETTFDLFHAAPRVP